MTDDRRDSLPRGWAESTIGEIGEYLNGRAFKKTEWSATGRPIIRIQDLTGSRDSPNRFEGSVEPRYEISNGDLLISWAATLGVFWWTGGDAILNQHIFKVQSYIDRRFHFYLANHVLADLQSRSHGSGMVHVTRGVFDSTPIRLPPLGEQRRIVAAIEEHLSKLDAAVAGLSRVHALLRQYYASIRKAAFEGKLVEKSSAWTVQAIADLAELVEYGTSARATAHGLIPVLRMGNIVDGRLDLRTLKFLPSSHNEFPRLLLRDGDVLFNRTNSPELVGKSAVYSGIPKPCTFASYLIRLRFSEACNPHFVAMYLNSTYGRRWVASVVSQQVGQANVSGSKLKALAIPLPERDEQDRIIAEADRRLTAASQTEKEVDAALGRAKGVRKAVLTRAFDGKLVSQDSADEPAAVLLDRIRASRPTPSAVRKKSRRSP